LHIDRRLTWGETKESAIKEIETLIVGLNAKVEVLDFSEEAYTGLRYGMEKYYPTWKLPEDHSMIQAGVNAFTKLYNKAPVIDKWTFSTNGVVITGIHGIPTIGFGPGKKSLPMLPTKR
jgi:Acetylornithine deacetylase/Succinyl-diaminopimelate desuccinylase and related deacylases